MLSPLVPQALRLHLHWQNIGAFAIVFSWLYAHTLLPIVGGSPETLLNVIEPCDSIVARPNAKVGSIGVVLYSKSAPGHCAQRIPKGNPDMDLPGGTSGGPFFFFF